MTTALTTIADELEARAEAIGDYDRSLSDRLMVIARGARQLMAENERLRAENERLRAALANRPEMVP